MNTVKLAVNVDKAEAIKAGKSVFGDMVVEIKESDLATFTHEERETLAGCLLNREDVLELWSPISGQRHTNDLPLIAEATIANVRLLLAALQKAALEYAANEKRKHDDELKENIDKALAASDEEWLLDRRHLYAGGWEVVVPGSYLYSQREEVKSDSRIAARIEELREVAKTRSAEHYELVKLKNEKAEKEKEAVESEKARKAAARAEQLAVWVQQHGTENQRKRQDRGLLPEAEILAAIRAQVFEPLAEWPLYEKITNQEVWSAYDVDDEYEKPEVTFSSWQAEELTAEEFEKLEEAEKLVPGCKAEVFVHLGRLCRSSDEEDMENEVSRKSIRITVDLGEITVGRRFAL
ncbi:MAG: hypothetical protein EOL92_00505 [Bacteroidia bacterium]|nr:hypothetical protein [Bacteroidia bacterium]